MKRTEAMAVGDILRAMIESDGNSATFDRQKLCYLWSEIVGPEINRHTIKRYVDGDALHVYISSGPLKSELAYVSDHLVQALNEATGHKVIKKIIIH